MRGISAPQTKWRGCWKRVRPYLFEVNALGFGILRSRALFFAFHEEIYRFGFFLLLGRRRGREFFPQRPVTDPHKFYPVYDDNDDEKEQNGIQCALSLHGEKIHGCILS